MNTLNHLTQEVFNIVRAINADIPIDSSENLLSEGYIDSFGIANIVPALEEYFQIDLSPEDIIPENFTSIDSMISMIQRKMREE